MYDKKIQYLRDKYPKDDCFSIMVLGGSSSVQVGTPAIAKLTPFAIDTSPYIREKRMFNIYAPESDSQDSESAEPAIEHMDDQLPDTPHIVLDGKRIALPRSKSGNIKVRAKDLIKMDPMEVKTLLKHKVSKMNVLVPFGCIPNSDDYLQIKLPPSKIHFDGKMPLIFDEGHSFETKRLSDVHSKHEIKNFAEMSHEALKNHRYLNYTFVDVAQSNKKYMLEDINSIFNSLKSAYPENVSFFQHTNFSKMRCLVDTISISLYRLEDTTAIFDVRRADGLAAEIFLTNSAQDVYDMGKEARSATYRFFFSKSRENIFTIDGELIRRQNDRPTLDALHHACFRISEEMPNDNKLKKAKTQSA